MNLADIKEKLDFSKKFNNLTRRLRKNSLLAHWYLTFAGDLEFDDLPVEVINSRYFSRDFWNRRLDDLKSRSARVSLCSKFWSGDEYALQSMRDLNLVNLCRDRFCDNCQNTLSVQRSDKYTPLLLKLSEEYDIYHCVLTVPNCTLGELSNVLDNMLRCYKYLVRYFDGRSAVSGVDYAQLGYLGSIRAMEITKNVEKETFHPHFHCLFVCRKGSKVQRYRTNVNIFSFKKNNSHIRRRNVASNEPDRFFSDFEILLQKTWRLLYDGAEVCKKNIEDLELGYSCMLENARGRYKEVFKYATKGLLSSDPARDPKQNYSDFVLLFVALFRRRLIQGYGALYRLKFDNHIDLGISGDELYMQVLKELHSVETPFEFRADLDFLERDMSNRNVCYISRKMVASLVADDE